MGRKAGSKNKPKSESPNGVGHNSGEAGVSPAPLRAELSDDEKQVLFFQHLGLYKSALKAKKAADEAFKAVCKLAKAECGDHAVADIKTAIELKSPEGEAELRARIERNLRVARWMGASIGTQADLFGDGVDRTPAVDKAFADGRRHGLAGDPCNPPYDASSSQYQRFVAGFHEGNAILAQGIKRPEALPPPEAGMTTSEWEAYQAEISKGEPIGTEPATAQPE